MDVEKLKNDFVSQIRGLLVSIKGKCDLKQLRDDYRMLMGCDIPYRELGFNNTEQLLTSIPSLSITRTNGQILVDAKPTEKSAHITALVEKQRSSKKRTRTRRPVVSRSNYQSINRSVNTKWKPKNLNNHLRSSYQALPRVAAVSHNQFVAYPPSLPPRLRSRPDAYKDTSQTAPVETSNIPKVVEVSTPKPVEKQESEPPTESLSAKARRRLIQKMADINLNNDDILPPNNTNQILTRSSSASSTSSLISSQISPNVPGFNRSVSQDSTDTFSRPPSRMFQPAHINITGDYLADLKAFTAAHNLGEPSVKVITRKMKRKPTYYDCHIKVGPHSFSSYPSDFPQEVAAVQEAAKQALDELTAKYNRRQSLLISDDKDVLSRIPPIVKSHFHGIWNWQLEADYADKYSEQLPINWLEIVDTIACISVTPCLNKYVLRYCKPGEKGVENTAPLISNVSIPSNTVQFNTEGWLLAEITCATSAGEIWCRQMNTSECDSFTSMIAQLEEYYNKNGYFEKIASVEVGGYYVASCDSMWSRVRVFEIDGDDIHCFCIDFGDELVVNKNNMHRLQRYFAKEQAQAFVCRLAGVEELYEASKQSEYLLNLVGKLVHIQLDSGADGLAKVDPNDPALSVIMYDPETSEAINEEITSYIGIESALPILNKNAPTEVYVSHAENNGSIYVQVRSVGYEQLKLMLEQLEQAIKEDVSIQEAVVTPENSKGRFYFAKDIEDKRYYRTVILDWSPCKKFAQIMYVDTGKATIIKIGEQKLYALDELSDVINRYPAQALRVKMFLGNIPSNFSDIISNLMPYDQMVLVKLIEEDETTGHIVEFFKRSETNNVLFSVNNAISASDEFKKLSDGDGNNNTNKIQSLKIRKLISLNQFEDSSNKNVPSTGSLTCPILPKINEYFDVRIPCAVHPHNFFVQPRKSQDKLGKLMAVLQERYKDVHHSPLDIADILPGKIYASKHEDGMWYRTSVIKVIHSGSISVFYCDFGYYANLTLQQLVPLDPEFMELPYQAIKAKLADIQPKYSKWSMDDCKFFEQLVCKKAFVSLLMGIEKDVLYRYDTVLSLMLIDTTTNSDVYINKILINEGIAMESTKK